MKENIEEDIEVMENIITHYIEADKCGLSNNDFKKEIKALSNILSDYKRLLKENEELKEKWDKDTHKLQNDLDIANAERIDWQKAYQEEKDKQFELLRENQLAKEALKEQCDIADERNQLLKENKELKHKYDVFVKMSSDVIANSIPTQKVKDKIEELSEGPLTINENNKYYYETDAYNKIIIQVLQDLLEEKGE